MKSFLKYTAGLLLVAALLAALLAGTAHFYIHRPEMIEKIRLFCATRLGTDVEFDSLKIYLFRGLKLDQVRFYTRNSAPEGQPDPGHAADPFLRIANIRLRYSPLQLARRRLEFKSIHFEDPSLHLVRNADGTWPRSPFSFFGRNEDLSFRTGFLRWDILLDHFEVQNAAILLADNDGSPMYRASKIDIDGELTVEPGQTNAKGRLAIGTMTFGSFFTLEDCTSTFEYANKVLGFPALNARAHGGSASGNAFIDLGIGGPSFGVEIDLQSVSLADITEPKLQDGQTSLRGYLQAHCKLEGSLNQPRLVTGTGTMEIREVVLPRHVYQAIANELFPSGILPDIGFEKITGSYKIAEEKVTFYKLEARAAQLQLTGTGTLSFSRKIDLDVMMAFGPELGGLLRPEIRSRLNRREDGFHTLTFRITGTLQQPVSNLREKLGLPQGDATPPASGTPTPAPEAVPAA